MITTQTIGGKMSKRGRPRKAGKRTSGGRLKRNNYPVPVFDKGSDWVQAQRARYGEHYSSGLGRAYAAGLLGEGIEAKNRYDASKRFLRLYARFIGGAAYTCPLDDSPRGGNVVDLAVSEQQERDHRWLFAAMDSMDVSGCRPYFDQLISVLHVDHGPYWLDALLGGGKHPADVAVLNAAIRAMDIIAPEAQRSVIRALTWN